MVFVELLCWVNVKWSQGCLVFMVSTAKAFVVSSGAKAVLLLNEWWVEPRLFYCSVNGAEAALLLSEWRVEPRLFYCYWVNVKWSQGFFIYWVNGAMVLVLLLRECQVEAVLLFSELWVEPRLFYCYWVNVKWSQGFCTVNGATVLVLLLSECQVEPRLLYCH